MKERTDEELDQPLKIIALSLVVGAVVVAVGLMWWWAILGVSGRVLLAWIVTLVVTFVFGLIIGDIASTD